MIGYTLGAISRDIIGPIMLAMLGFLIKIIQVMTQEKDKKKDVNDWDWFP